MDDATLNAYDRDANSFARDWETQPPPTDHCTRWSRNSSSQAAPRQTSGCGSSSRDAADLTPTATRQLCFDASGRIVERGEKAASFATRIRHCY